MMKQNLNVLADFVDIVKFSNFFLVKRALVYYVTLQTHINSVFFFNGSTGENVFPVNSPSKLLGTGDFSKFSKNFLPVNSLLKKKTL